MASSEDLAGLAQSIGTREQVMFKIIFCSPCGMVMGEYTSAAGRAYALSGWSSRQSEENDR
jgi:hypothetical protein